MEKSKVYFTSMRTKINDNLLQKLERLIKTAGIEILILRENMLPSKFISANPATWPICAQIMQKVVADAIKELGGKPF